MCVYVVQEMTAMYHRCMKDSKVGVYVKHHIGQWDSVATEGSP